MEENKTVNKRVRIDQKSYKMDPINAKWLKIEAALRDTNASELLNSIVREYREKSNKSINEEYN